MNLHPPKAVVVDGDVRVLAEAARRLTLRGVRVALRRGTEDLLEYASRVRPEIVLLGDAAWGGRWVDAVRQASPESLVFRLSPDGGFWNYGLPGAAPEPFALEVEAA